MHRRLHVVAGLMVANGRLLATRKRPGLSNAGLWEFPGGKVEAGERPEEALTREILEELGLQVLVADLWHQASTSTTDLTIDLDCYWVPMPACLALHSTDHDLLQWCTQAELARLNFAPADLPVVSQLLRQNPDQWLQLTEGTPTPSQ